MIVKIGALLYRVCWKHRPRFKAKFVVGLIDYYDQRIDTYVGLSPATEWVNLWHETVHGILHNAGIDDHDENMVNALAHGICQVLVDNPKIHDPLMLTDRLEPEDVKPETSIEKEFEYDFEYDPGTNSNTLDG